MAENDIPIVSIPIKPCYDKNTGYCMGCGNCKFMKKHTNYNRACINCSLNEKMNWYPKQEPLKPTKKPIQNNWVYYDGTYL